MKKLFSSTKRSVAIAGFLLTALIVQSYFLWQVYSHKDDKVYEVNLVQIKDQRDSLDYSEVKKSMTELDYTVRHLSKYFSNKGIRMPRLEALNQDRLANSIYLNDRVNRYNSMLAAYQKELQEIPLGYPVDGRHSSQFGKRIDPISKKMMTATFSGISSSDSGAESTPAPVVRFHSGMDIAVPIGTGVKATANGTVIFAGTKGGYGKAVIVSHGNGIATLYGHLSKILVKPNDKVKDGDIIAESGNTGRSTGPHVHYEVRKNDQPVNPKLFSRL